MLLLLSSLITLFAAECINHTQLKTQCWHRWSDVQRIHLYQNFLKLRSDCMQTKSSEDEFFATNCPILKNPQMLKENYFIANQCAIDYFNFLYKRLSYLGHFQATQAKSLRSFMNQTTFDYDDLNAFEDFLDTYHSQYKKEMFLEVSKVIPRIFEIALAGNFNPALRSPQSFRAFWQMAKSSQPRNPLAWLKNPFLKSSQTPTKRLLSYSHYKKLLQKQNAGEVLDLSMTPRPAIATLSKEGKISIMQGSGRYVKAKHYQSLDVFVKKGTPLPEGSVVVQKVVNPETVRMSNLLSSRGAQGANPNLVNVLVDDVAEYQRVLIPKSKLSAPLVKETTLIKKELTKLSKKWGDEVIKAVEKDKIWRSFDTNQQLQYLRYLNKFE